MVELIWDGKYDDNGRKTAPLRLKLPFQTVETVNESAQQRQAAFDLFSTGRPAEWRNRLIWGDKKYVLPALLDEFAGQVDLIYIDPPFNVGADFSYQVKIEDEQFTKEASIIEQKAYRDTWGRGLDSYIQWFYETVVLLRDLLSDTGSIYIHLDWHISHYAKAVLDEVYGHESFRNEIVWHYSGWRRADNKQFSRKHDVIFFYSKSSEFWNYHLITESWVSGWDLKQLARLTILNDNNGDYFVHKSKKIYLVEFLADYIANRRQSVKQDETGQFVWADGRNTVKRYLKDVLVEGRAVDNVWSIRALTTSSKERLGYDTQKPEALLERIINASSNEGDLVLDCFAGSGTMATVAEKSGRRWITCDLGRFAIHTTRKRLLSIDNVKPFMVQNLGKYERQAWQSAEFGDSQTAAHIIAQYRHFILELYNARPVQGYTWLHGLKAGRMVHIGAVDSPVSPGDVQQIALEFRKAVGTGADAPQESAVDVLGWDFAFELNEVAKQQAAQANIAMRFIRIPREVLEKKAVEQGDIKFFELAALSVDVAQAGRGVNLTLTDFVIPPDDVPQDIQAAITHWAQWIDYWAVDWDNKGDTFHNMWQTYRSRQNKSLGLKAGHQYDEPGEYRIMVKVIDILGNDTTKTLQVTVK